MSLLEVDIVQKAQKGDRECLEKLLRDNYKIVYGYLFKLSMNEETAKDFTQDVMVKAIVNIKAFRGTSKFSTWLISIASNAYKDSLRRKWAISLDTGDLKLKSNDNVEDLALNKDVLENLKKILMDLPDDMRKVFVLKHYYNYSYDEIAGIMKCPIGTVRSRLHNCVRRIRSRIGRGEADA
jgi:RNA polymerase sigma-70 factor, ECF subfamily